MCVFRGGGGLCKVSKEMGSARESIEDGLPWGARKGLS